MMLVPRVEGRRKQAPGLPFECDRLVACVVPKLRGAPPAKDENLLLVHMAQRLETFPRRDFRNQNSNESLGAFQVAVGRRTAPTLPVLERRGLQIANPVAGDERQPVLLAKFQKR